MSFSYFCHNVPYQILQYKCDALDLAIADLYGDPSVDITAQCWRVGDKAGFAWPFAAGSAERAIKLRALYFYTSSPNEASSWIQTQTDRNWTISTLSTWPGWTSEYQLGICGIPAYVGGHREPVTGDVAIVPPSNLLNFPGNDYNACIIFTGWNGASTAIHQPLRYTNTYWNVYRTPGSTYVGRYDVSMVCSLSSNGAGGTQLNISVGNSPNSQVQVVNLGSLTNQWVLLHLNIESWGDANGQYADIYARAWGRITSSTGEYTDIDVTGFRREAITAGQTCSSIDPSTDFGSAGGQVYGRPAIFQDASADRAAAYMFIAYSNEKKTMTQIRNFSMSFRQIFESFVL